MSEIRTHQRKGGFTLIELLVVISVFVLLSTLTVANFRTVDNSLILRNVASQAALVVRKAQIYGVSVTGIQKDATTAIFPSYGINFNMSSPGVFTLFADINPRNNFFNNTGCPPPALGVDECIQRYIIANGYQIKELRGNRKTSSPGTVLARLDITFTRPNPDTVIRGFTGAGWQSFSDGEVVIESIKSGNTKTVVIWKTGQISVE